MATGITKAMLSVDIGVRRGSFHRSDLIRACEPFSTSAHVGQLYQSFPRDEVRQTQAVIQVSNLREKDVG